MHRRVASDLLLRLNDDDRELNASFDGAPNALINDCGLVCVAGGSTCDARYCAPLCVCAPNGHSLCVV